MVLIVGAGPAGMAVWACLAQAGVRARLVDRSGMCGGAYRILYPQIEMASPARWISLPGLRLQHPREYITVGEYRAYLDRYASSQSISVERAEVTHVEARGGAFEVTFAGSDSLERYDAVIAASGMVDFPWRPSIPGCEGLPHAREWRGPEAVKGHLLIVGGGQSAVEMAEETGRAGRRVTVSTSTGRVSMSPQRLLGRDAHDFAYAFSWLPRWLLGSFCDRPPTFTGPDRGFTEMVSAGRIDVRGPVARFDGMRAVFADGGEETFDEIVLATGYRYAAPYLPSAVRRASGGHPVTDGGECRGVPGLYVMGAHCSRGVSSQFLRGIALDAPAVARRARGRLQEKR